MQHSSSNSLVIGSNTSQFITKNNTRVVSQRGGFAILPCSVTMSTPATVSKYLILKHVFLGCLLCLLVSFSFHYTWHDAHVKLCNITPVSATRQLHPSSLIETFISRRRIRRPLSTHTHTLRDAQIIFLLITPLSVHLFFHPPSQVHR